MHALLITAAIIFGICWGSTVTVATPHLFGTAEFRTGSLAALPQWQNVLDRIAAEQDAIGACQRDRQRCSSETVAQWVDFLLRQKALQPREQMINVNKYFNRVRYRSDAENYGRRDYWSSPLQFLSRSGDCEDYAIAKYHTLRNLGFSPSQLRLVVVRDTLRNIPHAILAVYLDDNVYVLDNLSSDVSIHASLSHYAPYYSVNEIERWVHTPLNAIVVSSAGR